jgi:hypothetical protein
MIAHNHATSCIHNMIVSLCSHKRAVCLNSFELLSSSFRLGAKFTILLKTLVPGLGLCTWFGTLGIWSIALFLGCIFNHSDAVEFCWFVQPDQVMLVNNQCIYPHTPAFTYAIVAAVALLVAHILVNILAGCICCDRGPSGYAIPYGGKRSVAMINFFLAWYVHVPLHLTT